MFRHFMLAWFCVLGVGACAADSGVGTATLWLTGQAPSGTVYRLRNAELTLGGPGSSQVVRTEDDPARTVIDAELPVGAYTLSVGAGWRVERISAGQPQPVVAELLSPSPLDFEVRAGAVTPVTLRFRVGADIVDMGRGTVEIGVGFEEASDAGTPDAGVPDAGTPDAGVPDATPTPTEPPILVEVSEDELFEGTAIAARVRLAAPPTGAVVITAGSSDPAALVAAPAILAFTPTTWNIPQALTIISLPDGDAVAGVVSLRLTAPGAAPVEVALAIRDRDATGTVTVRVFNRGTYSRGIPVADAQVLFDDLHGTVTRVATDAAGEARATVVAGSSVTVVEVDERRFTTIERVEPGDVLVVGDPRTAFESDVSAVLHLPAAPDDETTFHAAAPCGGDSYAFDTQVFLELGDCPSTPVPILATRSTWDHDEVLRGYFVSSAVLAPGTEVTLDGPWLTPATINATTTSPELSWFPNRLKARLYLGNHLAYEHRADYYLPGPDWIGYASFPWPRGGTTWLEHQMVTDKASQLLATAYDELPTALAITDTDLALPWVTTARTTLVPRSPLVDGATWTVGDGMLYDGTIAQIDAHGDWTVVTPARLTSTSELRLPALPSDLAALWEGEDPDTGEVRVRLVQASSITSYRQLRAIAVAGEEAGWVLPELGLTGTARYSENVRD